MVIAIDSLRLNAEHLNLSLIQTRDSLVMLSSVRPVNVGAYCGDVMVSWTSQGGGCAGDFGLCQRLVVPLLLSRDMR